MSKDEMRIMDWERGWDIISLIMLGFLFVPIINKISSLSCISVTNKMWMLLVIGMFILIYSRYLMRVKK